MVAGAGVWKCIDVRGYTFLRGEPGRAPAPGAGTGAPDRYADAATDGGFQDTCTRCARWSGAMMAWHIFRKDWRLMWPLAAGVALLQVLIVGAMRHSEPFPMPQWLSGAAALLTFGLAIAMTLLILLTIQQESIASINQDWLTRPIKRRDLLLGKLLTLALLIHGPIVFVNILQGLAEGFSLGPVLQATLDSNFEVALCYTLPVMAISAMTRSVVEAIIFGLVVLVVAVSLGFVSSPTAGTGLKWIWRSLAHGELLMMTLAAL